MKKILFIAVSALTALMVSCNMDKFPHGSILESEGVKTMSDATQLRVSIYTPMKSLLGGGRYTLEEIRGGMFHASIGFGNASGDFYRWEMQSTSQDAEALWYGDYGGVASVNYAIGAYEKLLADTQSDLTEADKATVADYLAEAHVTRALLYWDLVTKFCVAYDPVTASETLGLPLQTVYNPTSDVTKYPGRSSLAETYKLIENDLLAALDLSTAGKANSNYFTKDVVKALLARVYLNMKDWDRAAQNAQDVISNTAYALASTPAELESMYISDTSKELIFVVAGSVNDKPTATGSSFINDSETGDGSTPDPLFIPTKTLVDLYAPKAETEESDMRYPIFFKNKEVTEQSAGTHNIEVLWKFAGNPAYQQTEGRLNYINAGKIRLAEMYLTLAEALYMSPNSNLTAATTALNTLRAARVDGYVEESYTAKDVLPAIKDEWTREFCGEGFRMINMKRWGDDIVFGEPQVAEMVYKNDDLASLNKPINHTRCVWPIPKKEMDINPQLKGQQNEGY